MEASAEASVVSPRAVVKVVESSGQQSPRSVSDLTSRRTRSLTVEIPYSDFRLGQYSEGMLLTIPTLVDGGHRAIKYSRIGGVKKEIYSEGMR